VTEFTVDKVSDRAIAFGVRVKVTGNSDDIADMGEPAAPGD
jgi:hypothetical protein